MPNISFNTLIKALEDAGLGSIDLGTLQYSQQIPIYQKQITSQLQQEDPQLSQMKNNFLSQLQKVAEMDQKLSGVYGDPTSKLFIEHPLARERIKGGAYSTGIKAAGRITDLIKTRKKDIEETGATAGNLLRLQLAIQDKEAKRAEKEIKTSKKATGRSTKSSTSKSTAGSKKNDYVELY